MRFVSTMFAFAYSFFMVHAASAEVLDKLEVPWEPRAYVHMFVVLVCASLLAASMHVSMRLAGLIVAIVWATVSIWTDPWFTPDIGDALRAELTDDQRTQWLRAILVQALVPVGVTLVVFLWRTLTMVLGRQAPR